MTSYDQLIIRIKQIHTDCQQLCYQAVRGYLPIAGNIGIFCQSEHEFKQLTEIKNQLTLPSDNPNQKYFELKIPIFIPSFEDIPSAIYTHLYIRNYDPTPYGKYLGDVDFVLSPNKYIQFKNEVNNGTIKGAETYNRPGWDTIGITDPYNSFCCIYKH